MNLAIHNRYLDLNWQSKIRLLELKIGLGKYQHWLVRFTLNMPIADSTKLTPTFVRKSSFFARSVVQPEGGGSPRLVCEECGTEYPYTMNMPCANCAVPKESGLMLCLWRRTWRWTYSSWGWAVKDCGRWVCEEGSMDDKRVWRPIRFKSWRKAQSVRDQLYQEYLDLMDGTVERNVLALGRTIEVVLYPVKSAVSMTMPGASAYDDPLIRIVKL